MGAHRVETSVPSVEHLSPVDAAWFRMEQGKDPADIVSLLLLDGQVDEDRLRAVLVERLLVHRRFRRRVVETPLGVAPPRWEDEPGFSLDAHLSRRRVRPPGGEAELAALMTELVNEPLDFGRSPWRVCIIEGMPAGSVLFTQIHHCMGDGFALVKLLLSLADRTAGGGDGGPPATVRGEPATADRALHVAMTTARRVGRGISDLSHLLLLPFDPKTRLRGALRGERRVAWSNPIALSRVKALAHARGATVNDVLMAALSGALRRYVSFHGDVPELFRAIVPVNLRAPSEPFDEEHGNRFGLVFVDLPIGEEDREARLADVKREMDRIKASEEPTVSLAVLNVLGRSPAFVSRAVDQLFGRKATLVVTNVPGPRTPLYLAGSRIRDILFWAPHPSGLSCGVSILSYAGSVRAGVRSDTALVPDPERIAHEFEMEILEWEGADTGRSLPTA